jgi:hypothetical protein
MLNLGEYIKGSLSIWDCHVHLFGVNGIIPYKKPYDNMIVMVENVLNDQDLMPCFDELFKKDLPKNIYPLCVGKDKEETKEIYNKYKDKFFGIGEIKAYKHYKNIKNVEKEHFDKSILEDSIQYHLPIFIHWDLNGKHDDELYNIIKSNKDTTFILCHCGMNELDNQVDSFNKAIEFQTTLPNLWLDISWVTLDYLTKNTNELSKIEIPDHVLTGTNHSSLVSSGEFDDIYDNFKKIYQQFNILSNIKNLISK